MIIRILILFLFTTYGCLAQTYCLDDICGSEYGIFVAVDVCCNTVEDFTFTVDSNQPGFPITIVVGPEDVETSPSTGSCSEITYYHLGCFDPSFSYQVTADNPVLSHINITHHDIFLFHAHIYDIELFEEECELLAADIDQDDQIALNDFITGYTSFLFTENLQYPWFWDYTDLVNNDNVLVIGLNGGEMGEFDCKKEQDWSIENNGICETVVSEKCEMFSDFYYSEIYSVCLGDTILVQDVFEPENQTYVLDDLNLLNWVGEELILSKDTIQLHLDKIEEGCLCIYQVFSHEDALNVDVITCKWVNVIEENKLEIEAIPSNSSNHTLCLGEAIELFDNTTESLSPEWQVSNGDYYSTDTISISFDDPGVYEVILFDDSNCDCFESDTISITVFDEVEEYVSLMICAGNSIEYEGQQYVENELDTLYRQSSHSCDSLVYIEVSTFPEVIVDLTIIPTCSNNQTGQLIINDINQNVNTYLVDGVVVDSTDISNLDLAEGEHFIEVVTENNCSKLYDFTIEVSSDPNIVVTTSETCASDSNGYLLLDNFSQYPINTSLHLDSLNSYESEFFNLQEGNYTLFVEDTLGCIHEFPFEINSFISPTLEINVENSCFGQSNGVAIISVFSGNPLFALNSPLNYTSNTVYNELEVGPHKIYILTEDQCQDSIDFYIDEYVNFEFVVEPSSSCFGQETGILYLSNIENIDSIYIDDLPIPLTNEIYDLGEGKYELKVIDINGCVTILNFDIESSQPLSVIKPEVIIDCSTAQLLLDPEIVSMEGELYYQWSNGLTDSRIVVSKSGEYTVTINDDCDEVIESWDIEFPELVDENSIFIPNIFMPTTTPPNNCFTSLLSDDISLQSFHLMIYDPWGNLVFETKDHLDCWDGRFNNELVESGVYIYVNYITIMQCDRMERFEKIGDVTLIY